MAPRRITSRSKAVQGSSLKPGTNVTLTRLECACVSCSARQRGDQRFQRDSEASCRLSAASSSAVRLVYASLQQPHALRVCSQPGSCAAQSPLPPNVSSARRKGFKEA